ncbi:MAG: histidinol-phosphate aminotransferase family protein [Nitrospirae bacterium]|nr:histidinol-phosphate aminotransferase family protein [Nitrospirota bacterium]
MNESVTGLPKEFITDVIGRIDPDYIASYPAYERCKEKIAKHNNLLPTNICMSNGSDAAIKYIFDTYISPSDKVLLTEPTFAMYPIYCRIFNCHHESIPYNDDLSFPKEEFLDAISHNVKMAVVINPNNPTGSVVDEPYLDELMQKSAQQDVLLVIDEAYFYFYPHTSIKHVNDYPNVIVLRTFSKLCAMASLRLGYAAGNKQLIEDLQITKSMFDVNGIAILFAETLLSSPEVINGLIEDVNRGRLYLKQRLIEKNIKFYDGYANFILIECGHRVDEIIRRLSEKRILINGYFKQAFLKKYVRVTLGNANIMEKFWDAFISIWNS